MRGLNERRRTLLTMAALAFLVACGGNSDESNSTGSPDKGTATASPVDDWRPEFDEMASALSLQGPERDALEAAFQSRDQKLRDWLESPDGTRFLKLEDELREATADRDLGRVRSITDRAGPLRRNFETMIESTQRDILASLSPEKQREWDMYQLYMKLYELMEPVGLSEEQKSRLREATFDFLRRAHQNGEPNPMAAAFLEYERWAEISVLDSTQRGMYQAIKKENPLRSLR